ncbi:hypothetical protein INN71_10540 [Nocardioides sp. ChNu-153]|uniref:hypothetical protein n=1 Tax=unclassified Nocardioides TaxID=2615069 RepID=UPI002406B1D4|nr:MULTISPECIES: hypothetical protein [unclassified Nocardioides]MDF9717707.1 hypothetical protein [Nocardioides sp. ChNu-99]MDN7121826.1 hypothetical protein [Nocardioides sp. ChNu-153]
MTDPTTPDPQRAAGRRRRRTVLVTSRWAASAAVLAAVATGVVGTEPGEGSGAGTAVVRAEGAGTEDGAQP